jgi:hypothetical protein
MSHRFYVVVSHFLILLQFFLFPKTYLYLHYFIIYFYCLIMHNVHINKYYSVNMVCLPKWRDCQWIFSLCLEKRRGQRNIHHSSFIRKKYWFHSMRCLGCTLLCSKLYSFKVGLWQKKSYCMFSSPIFLGNIQGPLYWIRVNYWPSWLEMGRVRWDFWNFVLPQMYLEVKFNFRNIPCTNIFDLRPFW